MRFACLCLFVVGLGACAASQIPTLKEYGDASIGLNISVIRELVQRPGGSAQQMGWQERTYPLANGNWVYVEPSRARCEIHYEVDGEDIIIGYTTVGPGCRNQ